MSDYIDRQAAIDALNGEIIVTGKANAEAVRGYINLVEDRIKRLPSIEAEPVKRGKWINDKGLYRCSECNELWTKWWANVVPIERMNKMMKYCPNCGAKMEPISASPENGQEQRRSPDASL